MPHRSRRVDNLRPVEFDDEQGRWIHRSLARSVRTHQPSEEVWSGILKRIREDYTRTALAKGLSERLVMVRHALKDVFISVATIVGPLFAALVTGTFIVEQVFAVPGMGKYFVTSISNRDDPVVMGTILL